MPIQKYEIEKIAAELRDSVDAVAISGYLSIRNPKHELQIKTLIRVLTGLPVFCAHELSGSLGYYERTVTAVLNASLVFIIGEFLVAVQKAMKANSITAPIMVVKGDGTLIQESMALERPVDTILSGPAASVIGAGFLSDIKDGMIYDMGGTTSDIAIIENGRAYIAPNGAKVDCWETHIRAANIHTFGIGGDSHIFLSENNDIQIGPEKVEPLCVASYKNPLIAKKIEEMNAVKKTSFPLYYKKADSCETIQLNEEERKVLEAITAPCTQDEILAYLQTEDLKKSLDYLVSRNLIIKASLTPTDLKHASGDYIYWDANASIIGCQIMANAMHLSLESFISFLSEKIYEKIWSICKETIRKHNKKLSPVIGIGAPAASWLPSAVNKMNATLSIPLHADVANAVGAALCPVSESAEAVLRYNKESNIYILFMPEERLEFDSREEAEEYAKKHLNLYVKAKASAAGAQSIKIDIQSDVCYSCDEYIQTVIRATATDSRLL